ncbi:YjcZ family sporulation protein [Bacillus sp. NP247]|nr:YjcZ family sporulation protein [Bacillus cereus]QWU48065.1 YjcZ family sporulation protein [Bacillus sp. NP247]
MRIFLTVPLFILLIIVGAACFC